MEIFKIINFLLLIVIIVILFIKRLEFFTSTSSSTALTTISCKKRPKSLNPVHNSTKYNCIPLNINNSNCV